MIRGKTNSDSSSDCQCSIWCSPHIGSIVDVIKNIVCLMHHNTIPFLLVQFRLMTSVLFRYIAKSEIWIDTLRSKPTSYLKITSAKDLSNYLVSQPDNNETMIRHFLCSQLPSRIIRSQTFLITLAFTAYY